MTSAKKPQIEATNYIADHMYKLKAYHLYDI
jgi:hypothetical protein